jgi:phospholipase/carboxylesterase
MASRDHLRTLGWNVSWHEYPIEHTVSLEEIQDLEAWLHGRLAS